MLSELLQGFRYGPDLGHVIWVFSHLLVYNLVQETLPSPGTLGRGPGVGGLGWLGWAGLGQAGLG